MYFTPRGISTLEQSALDAPTALRFLELLTDHKDISIFFTHFGMQNIAIAGAGQLGKCLMKALNDSPVNIRCFFDQTYHKFSDGLCMGVPILPYESAASAGVLDAVVITSNIYFNEMADALTSSGVPLKTILSINDVLFGVERLKI